MNSLNSILLEGNLVREPEFGHTSKGTPFCNFSIASNRYYKIEDKFEQEVSFFNVTAWSKLAELCEKKIKKGKRRSGDRPA
jgi:single-strand DNA-binding protein